VCPNKVDTHPDSTIDTDRSNITRQFKSEGHMKHVPSMFLLYRNFAAQQGAVIVWRMNHHILLWLHRLDLGVFWVVLQPNCTVLLELILHIKGMYEMVAETKRMEWVLADIHLDEGNKI